MWACVCGLGETCCRHNPKPAFHNSHPVMDSVVSISVSSIALCQMGPAAYGSITTFQMTLPE